VPRIDITPQPGPQTDFFETSADICIYGGSAGGGKSWSILAEPLRHYYNSQFSGVIFRRTTPQILNPGGLWDAAGNLYAPMGAKPQSITHTYTFKTGMRIRFAHLEHEKNKYDWQGSEISFLGFDELTHFSESQFFYLLGRNRSTCGVRPYVRATCNPDADSWVAKFIAWWIDDKTGLPIPERSGKIRYFIRHEDTRQASCPTRFYHLRSPDFDGAIVLDLVSPICFV